MRELSLDIKLFFLEENTAQLHRSQRLSFNFSSNQLELLNILFCCLLALLLHTEEDISEY